MNLKMREILHHVLMFSESNYYSEWRPYLLELVEQSRSPEIITSHEYCLALQFEILDCLTKLEEILRLQKTEHEMKNSDRDVIYNIRLRRIIKDIADGIAWRVLGFNRPIMRILSQNQSPGYTKATTSKEDEVALKIISYNNAHVLINDITNILRIGDLTCVKDGLPKIVEVKKSGRQIRTAEFYHHMLSKGGALDKQGERIIELDDIINNGQVKVGDFTADLVISFIPIDTYHKELSLVLSSLEEKSVCGRFVDRLMYIRALQLDESANYEVPFKFGEEWMHFSSIDTLWLENDEVYRNKIPYSCFPLPDHLIVDILAGKIILEAYLNLNALKRYYERAGWKVKLLNRNWGERITFENPFQGDSLFPREIDSSILLLKKDGFNQEIKVEHLCQIFLDYLKPDILLQLAKTTRKATEKERRSGAFGVVYDKEKYIWV